LYEHTEYLLRHAASRTARICSDGFFLLSNHHEKSVEGVLRNNSQSGSLDINETELRVLPRKAVAFVGEADFGSHLW